MAQPAVPAPDLDSLLMACLSNNTEVGHLTIKTSKIWPQLGDGVGGGRSSRESSADDALQLVQSIGGKRKTKGDGRVGAPLGLARTWTHLVQHPCTRGVHGLFLRDLPSVPIHCTAMLRHVRHSLLPSPRPPFFSRPISIPNSPRPTPNTQHAHRPSRPLRPP